MLYFIVILIIADAFIGLHFCFHKVIINSHFIVISIALLAFFRGIDLIENKRSTDSADFGGVLNPLSEKPV